jgi:hypothetical protein
MINNSFSTTSRPNRRTALFGGNSNWRGPVWFPLNFLLIEALQKHHYFLGDAVKVELPAGSGNKATLWEVATELSFRLIKIFLKDESGRRPVYGRSEKFQSDPHGRDLILFHDTSMEIPELVSAPAIRPDGRGSSLN